MDPREGIADAIRGLMQGLPVEAHDPSLGMPLQVVPYGAEEVIAALDCLLSTWVTMGKQVQAFEAAWAEFCGARYGVMLNSGSSANLVALGALLQSGRLQRGDEVLVPAVAWSTSLFPIAQLGLVPVLVDVDPDTLCISVEAARAAMGPRTKGVMPVHLLGQPAEVEALRALGLVVMEDACAAPGAEIGGRRVGAIGEVGTFSFFFSHHLTTIEGGMLVTDDAALADHARSLRAHGWVRERSDRDALAEASPEIDARFLFVSAGWNLRPTELAGAFGLKQLERLPAWLDTRRENHRAWCARLAHLAPLVRCFPELGGQRHAAMAFPLLVGEGVDREALKASLEARGVATRPISGSNLARQPAFAQLAQARIAGALPVADAVHERGFFVGNSHAFGAGHGALLQDALEEFFNGR
ncbi:MAG: DegT/DnrJ/EryC1/StrS family aminotransferase [Alphaproteobacteria bacterium]|nr:DegT/DnrJ/EryC1/StrS family aminotransferase [Alphaproteobacteria bacterium]